MASVSLGTDMPEHAMQSALRSSELPRQSYPTVDVCTLLQASVELSEDNEEWHVVARHLQIQGWCVT